MPSTLYICYFGLRQPLVQTQVLPYLREIRKGGTEVALLTFEPLAGENWEAEMQAALKAEGIDWHWLRYHKRLSVIATAYDIFRGALFVRRFIKNRRPNILHGRVHVPTLMAALGRKLSGQRPKLLFDIRGFFPEEYTDAGIWPANGILYRTAKRIERWLMGEADGFVVLTEKAREILFPDAKAPSSGDPGLWPNLEAESVRASKATDVGWLDNFGRPVEVIPCCVDFESRFSVNRSELRERTRQKLGVENRYVITHVGALGGLYLADEIADFLAVAKSTRPETFALFLTQSDPSKIILLLTERGFTESDSFVGRVASEDVPAYMYAADLGLSFVRSGYATQSRSPTKIP
ncbi:MAG: glycosyltransferase, partial [Acidobacteriota bacterium]